MSRDAGPAGHRPEQFSLAGFDDVPVPRDRLFFAIFPDPATAARIARLARELREKHGLTGRPLATDRFHVTLHHLGDYAGLPAGLVTAAGEAAAGLTMPPFEINFDRVLSFGRKPGKRPFVLGGGEGVAALTAFQQALGARLENAGLGGRALKAHYTPHLTLLYDDQGVVEQALEAVRWTAHEFVLVHSLLGQTRHVPLARWPLRT